jgi:hypothetical protein
MCRDGFALAIFNARRDFFRGFVFTFRLWQDFAVACWRRPEIRLDLKTVEAAITPAETGDLVRRLAPGTLHKDGLRKVLAGLTIHCDVMNANDSVTGPSMGRAVFHAQHRQRDVHRSPLDHD